MLKTSLISEPLPFVRDVASGGVSELEMPVVEGVRDGNTDKYAFLRVCSPYLLGDIQKPPSTKLQHPENIQAIRGEGDAGRYTESKPRVIQSLVAGRKSCSAMDKARARTRTIASLGGDRSLPSACARLARRCLRGMQPMGRLLECGLQTGRRRFIILAACEGNGPGFLLPPRLAIYKKMRIGVG